MRPDNSTSSTSNNANGFSPVSNGAPTSPVQKSAVSGSLNGASTSNGRGNGSVRSPPAPTYLGHDREEVTRIIIQALQGMGYKDAASTLRQESRYELENTAVAAFKTAVLEGQWDEAERLLLGSHSDDGGGVGSAQAARSGELILAEGADRNEMLFCLRQQKFLECLERRDLARALMVLRQELTPLNHDTRQLHTLSRYVCRGSSTC